MTRSSSRRASSRSRRPPETLKRQREEEASLAEIARILAEERGLRQRSPSPKKKPRSARSRSRGRKSDKKSKSPKSKSSKEKKEQSPKTSPKKKSKKKEGSAASAAANHGGDSFEYEFGGPVGAVATTIALPLVCYGLFHFCGEDACPDYSRLSAFASAPITSARSMASAFPNLFTASAFAAVFGWFAFQIALERLLPCAYGLGAPIKHDGGKRLRYTLNGHAAFWVSVVALLLWQLVSVCQAPVGGAATLLRSSPALQATCSSPALAPLKAVLPTLPSLSFVHTHFAEMLTASLALSAAMSVALYVCSLRLPRGHPELALGGDSGVAVYDFFIGRELNPRPLQALGLADATFDLKYFCELHPGLIGWCAINFAMLCAQMERSSDGSVSGSMVLLNLCQLLYVWDALYNEKAILTTMDITTDGFGFMLCFGDLTWVPFTYTLQARYLVAHDPALSLPALMCIAFACGIGYWAFRGSNGEKDAFRSDPASPRVAHLETITTKTGRKLIVSGWWGAARKINYSADWLMGVSWCATCGGASIIPYFYAIYFGILLIHRAWRDDHACSHKYGKDWERYKKKVPYVFIPGVV